jgi:hypothetical protein
MTGGQVRQAHSTPYNTTQPPFLNTTEIPVCAAIHRFHLNREIGVEKKKFLRRILKKTLFLKKAVTPDFGLYFRV